MISSWCPSGYPPSATYQLYPSKDSALLFFGAQRRLLTHVRAFVEFGGGEGDSAEGVATATQYDRMGISKSAPPVVSGRALDHPGAPDQTAYHLAISVRLSLERCSCIGTRSIAPRVIGGPPLKT